MYEGLPRECKCMSWYYLWIRTCLQKNTRAPANEVVGFSFYLAMVHLIVMLYSMGKIYWQRQEIPKARPTGFSNVACLFSLLNQVIVCMDTFLRAGVCTWMPICHLVCVQDASKPPGCMHGFCLSVYLCARTPTFLVVCVYKCLLVWAHWYVLLLCISFHSVHKSFHKSFYLTVPISPSMYEGKCVYCDCVCMCVAWDCESVPVLCVSIVVY